MAEQIHINHSELRRHATNLESVASDIDGAGSAADGINLHNGAFGVMMAWLPGVVSKFVPVGSGAIGASAGTVRRTAYAVRELAGDFHDTDQQIADAMNAIKG